MANEALLGTRPALAIPVTHDAEDVRVQEHVHESSTGSPNSAGSMSKGDPSGPSSVASEASDQSGNICIAGGLSETVRCFDPNTHAQTFDYNAEVVATLHAGISPTIEPPGLAFDATNRLYLSSVFAGQVFNEAVPHASPMALLASGMAPELGYLTLDGTDLYIPSWGPEPTPSPDVTSNFVYKIDTTTGAVTNFITSHLFGPYQMIFARVSLTSCVTLQRGVLGNLADTMVTGQHTSGLDGESTPRVPSRRCSPASSSTPGASRSSSST